MNRAAATPESRAPSRSTIVAVLGWVAAFIAITLVAAAFDASTSASSDAPPIVRAGKLLKPNTPNARPQGDAISILNRREAPLTILAVGSAPFRAEDYGRVTLDTGPVPRGMELALVWLRSDDPSRPHEQPIELSPSGAVPTALDRNPEWRGDIRFVAVGVKGIANAPIEVMSFRLEPLGTLGTFADIVRGWLRFERWDGRSVNVVFGGREEQRVWLPAIAFAASAVALLAAWRAQRRRGGRMTLALLAFPFLIGWMLLDLRWQMNLFSQSAETLEDFGGRSNAERHLAMEDAELFSFIHQAMAKMPATPVRVFATSDYEYFRRRAGYHLYPHNVLAYDWAEPAVIRPGDYVLFYQKNDVRYDVGASELQWANGARLKAKPLLARRGAGLFLVESPAS